jgi:hypothetical protein
VPGIKQTFGLRELQALLLEDLDFLATAVTREQAAALQNTDERLLGTDTHWAETEEGKQRQREEKKAARERYEQEWGALPEFPA